MKSRIHRLLPIASVLLLLSVTGASPVFAVGESPESPSSKGSSVQIAKPDNSTWSFEFAVDASGNPIESSASTAKAFGYGICSGSFQNVTKQGNHLVWGAQSSCTASNNFFYLHQVRVDLYDSCLYGFCIFFEKTKTIVSPASSNYSRVATANGYDYCKGRSPANSRTYEQRVYVTIRDITFGPFAQQSGVPNCDIQP